MPFGDGISDEIDPDLHHRLITVSETTYKLYLQRGYCDGYDIDDRLQA